MTIANSQQRARQLAISLLGLCLAGSLVFAASSGAAGGVTPESSTAWLESELAASGVGFERDGQTDWGLTVDALIALGNSPERGAGEQRAIDGLVANIDSYITWDDYGSEYQGVLLAGPVAKASFAVSAQGLNPADVGGRNLFEDLRSLMVTTGAETGRIADRNLIVGNQSNMFGQAWAVLALERSTQGVPTQAVSFMLGQQCVSGAFPLLLDGAGCVSADEADTDATALAVEALVALDRSPAVEAALVDAANWLLGVVGPNGAVGGTGPTAGANSNSAALVALALDSVGQNESAALIRDWIGSVQVNSENAAGTAISSEIGAVAYTPASFSAAAKTGISDFGRDQWRRTTSQAVLAASGVPLAHYGVTDPSPLQPVNLNPAGTTTTTAASSTTTPGTSSTTTSTTTDPGASSTTTSTTAAPSTSAPDEGSTTTFVTDPAGVLSSSNVLDSGQASPPQVLSNNQISSTGGSSTLPLAITGVYAADLALVAFAFIALGVGLAAVAQRQGLGKK